MGRSDDEYLQTRRLGVDLDLPAFLDGLVAEKRSTELTRQLRRPPRGYTRSGMVVTHATHHGRQRVIDHDLAPCSLIVAFFGVVKPL